MKNNELEWWCGRLADRIAKLEAHTGISEESINEDNDSDTAQPASDTVPDLAAPPAADPGESPD